MTRISKVLLAFGDDTELYPGIGVEVRHDQTTE